MEIIVVARHGVPHAEIEAHRSIQAEFNSTPFSKPWRGYAAFALARPGRGTGDDDFDLVLITHADIVLIELKNWNGKLLKSDGRKWYLDGDDRGESPVNVINRKARKLASELDKRLGQKNRPFVSAYVVLHGNINKLELAEDEARSVLTMTQFLSFRFQDCYRENNPQGSPGFLRNPNRINVAISRAMERLVIVGSRTMWNQRNRDLPLGRVLTHIEAQMEAGIGGIECSEQFLE